MTARSTFMRRQCLLRLLALMSSVANRRTFALEFATRPIPTFRLDLTIKQMRKLLREAKLVDDKHGEPSDAQQVNEHGRQRALQSVDSTIQSLAERHLAAVYADVFVSNPPPSQVLLTVTTDDDDAASAGSGGGFYVRSFFLGGVVSFPNSSVEAPSRAALDRATLAAFQIPGVAGERFLKALMDEGHPELEGLLLVGVGEVDNSDYEEDVDPVGGEPSPLHEDNGGRFSMNIWAVAAVAALGAMFLVIILCTSILYCDWRTRRDRRQKKRARAVAMAAANTAISSSDNQQYSNKSSNKSKGINDHVELESVGLPSEDPNHLALQVVVHQATSGETEVIGTPSPSTQGSNENNQNQNNSFINISTPIATGGPSNVNSIASSKRGLLMGKIKSSRRSLPSIKSRAANAHLAEAEPALPLPQNLETSTDDEYAECAPSETNDGYSVGEDTTMLYPSMNRNRTYSREKGTADNVSIDEFDGYSMDGMSAMDGAGFSQYGGSALGSGTEGSGFGSAVCSSARKGSLASRDMYEVPRDFDSIWGDDDQSRLTTNDESMDSGNGYLRSTNRISNVHDKDKKAYGDLTKHLDELVEQEYGEEQSKESTVGGGGMASLLHEFDSESESGSKKGAFTLQLLGGTKNNASSAAADGVSESQDDEDSILGDMYRDEAMDDILSACEGEAKGEDKKNIPGSGDSVDSTPSWAAPIQSALQRSTEIFRVSPQADDGNMVEKGKSDDAMAPSKNMVITPGRDDDSACSRESQKLRTKEKLLSSLSSDENSVGSRGSDCGYGGKQSKGRDHGTSGNEISNGSGSDVRLKRDQMAVKLANENALGLTNSIEDEVDEDPAAMINNINSMLSECREILDTDQNVI